MYVFYILKDTFVR